MVPKMPNGTLTRNTARQLVSASSPPISSPMNEPASAATWLMPRAHAALTDGEGVGEDGHGVGHEQGPADPLDDAQADRSSAPAEPTSGVKASAIEARVKIRNPALYIRTRP